MSQWILIASQLMKPERSEALYEAMMDGTRVEGVYVMECTEYHEAGVQVYKLTLREEQDGE